MWAVGGRAYVHCPTPHAAVVLTDEFERVATASLDDGAAVEVRAWRPGATGGARYSVRAVDGAGEGWLGSEYLRATRDAPVAPPPTHSDEPPAPADPYGRRFGQR